MYDVKAILNDFSLPIMLTKDVKQLDKQIIDDLECLETKDVNLVGLFVHAQSTIVNGQFQ